MNITPEQIGAALAARVEEAFPGETVYQDITPRDFARPSNLVVLEKVAWRRWSCAFSGS